MDFAAYIKQQREWMSIRHQWVKDPVVFTFHYEPDEPVMRQECKQLLDVMLKFDLTGIPDHQAVIGSRGSGKTLMVKYLQRVVTQNSGLEVVYANCRHDNTSFKILASLLGVSATGLGLTELYQRFLDRYRKRTVVILDEIDLMSPKDKNREILYFLSRSAQPYLVIMLSNSPHVLNTLDPATRSSLQPQALHFKNYDAEQLQEILRDRAHRGLTHWDEGVLAQIAGLTTKFTNSDARVAIKTLNYIVSDPQQRVARCFDRAREDVVIDIVNDLSDSTLMILWAVATSPSDLAKEVYRRYGQFSHDQGFKPFSYVYFYSNLSYMQSLGLVGLMATKVDRTYTNRVMLTCEQSVVDYATKLRFDDGNLPARHLRARQLNRLGLVGPKSRDLWKAVLDHGPGDQLSTPTPTAGQEGPRVN
jgi:Cdc6-like AAA superfamily ATPase